ncbi:MAG TPA: dicarboxylate/amino acid:cation symporter, partial [Gallicola sp.]|nr:dicarboxylate/amino acid:cation symporter [Gallicola sp.]
MKKNNKLTIFIVIGLALGIIGGLVVPNFMNEISFLGTIYVNLLKFMIVPIIFTSIVGTIYNSKHKRSKVLIKSIITFVIMFVATFLLTTLVFVLIDPVKYVGTDINFVEWTGEISALNVGEILTNLFPSNIITMIQNNSVFAVILVSFLIGIAASKSKNGNKAIEVIDSFKEIFYKILEYIMYLTPIGVLSLVGSTIANYGSVIIGVGAVYIGIAYLCSILTLLL